MSITPEEVLTGPEPVGCVLSAVTSMPFMEEEGVISLFRDQYALDQKLEYLRMMGHDVDQAISDGDKLTFFSQLRDFGVTKVVFETDNALGIPDELPITAFVPEGPSGFVDLETPLANPTLDAKLNRIAILAETGERDAVLEAETSALLKETYFLIPFNIIQYRVENALIFPYVENTKVVPIFTSKFVGDLYIRALEMIEGEWSFWVMSWSDLEKLAAQDPNAAFVINVNGVAVDVVQKEGELVPQFHHG